MTAGEREDTASAVSRVLLAVSGGIAAYKAVQVLRLLRGHGASVRCALTAPAARFVAPLTFEVLSGQRVYREEYLEGDGSGDELHIALARWAQAAVVAPCTAHTLSRLALGLGDDFVTTCLLAFEGPLLVAPAMHPAMWSKPAIAQHARTLAERGVTVLGPTVGTLASGEVGMGRMVEPEEIARAVVAALRPRHALLGQRVLVTAGPTHEPLDPVRFLGNRSSGKMGFALAAEAARRGAAVTLVCGPVALATPAGVTRCDVGTAQEMQQAVARAAAGCDLIVMAAAVADFRPVAPAARKIKKEVAGEELVVRLVRNPDILASLSELAPRAVRVGFAAETDDLLRHAAAKLAGKRVDFLVANDVSRGDIGFGSEANEVVVLEAVAGGAPPVEHHLGRRPKQQLAGDLLDLFSRRLGGAR